MRPTDGSTTLAPSPRWQFRLRGMLLFVLVCALAFAYVGRHLRIARREADVAVTLGNLGAAVTLESSPAAPPLLRQLAPLHRLTTVSVRDQRWLSAEADLFVAELARLSDLRHLRLRHTPLESSHVRRIAALERLEFLALAECPLTSDDVRSLAALERLSWLDLSGTPIGDAALTSLPPFRRLVVLDLAGTAIGDASLAWIAQMPSLKLLDLSQTAVSDQGIGQLAVLTRLEGLGLSNTQVSEAAIARLQSALPALRVDDD